MNSKPPCAMDNCDQEGFILFSGVFVCGRCYGKYLKSMEQTKLENMKNALSTNPRNK